jgi:hypothetical protein
VGRRQQRRRARAGAIVAYERNEARTCELAKAGIEGAPIRVRARPGAAAALHDLPDLRDA